MATPRASSRPASTRRLSSENGAEVAPSGLSRRPAAARARVISPDRNPRTGGPSGAATPTGAATDSRDASSR